MIYVLIDTCSWKQLVSKIEVSEELKQIKLWADKNEISILCPETLMEEWGKHREKELNRIAQALKEHEKKLKLFKFEVTEAHLAVAREYLESQIPVIDDIFKSGVHFKNSNAVKLITFNQKRSNEAPFKNKQRSDNDSLIIFSTLEYCTECTIPKFIFLSDNINDFSVNENEAFKIHPDISKHFPEIDIEYFRKPRDFVSAILNRGGMTALQAVADITPALVTSGIVVDRTKSIIDQFYEYVTKRYDEITFYPLHLLVKDWPFSDGSDSTRYRLFTLITGNSVLFSLFKSMSQEKGRLNSLNHFIQIMLPTIRRK